MIRFLLRFLGLLVLAAAFILLIYDGAKSLADNRFYIYKLDQLWRDVHAGSLDGLKGLAERYVGDWIWPLIVVPVLEQPAWLVLGIVGILLMLLGRRKRPLIGYAR
jgi:hypothetical protein